VFIQPKTAASRRTIVLTQLAVEGLGHHHAIQVEHRLKVGDLWQHQDLIFCTDLGKPLDPMNTYRRFHKAQSKAGLPIMRQHDTRHTAATLMLAEGIHVKVVSEMVGHYDINLTQSVYQHLLPTMQRGGCRPTRRGIQTGPTGAILALVVVNAVVKPLLASVDSKSSLPFPAHLLGK